MAWDCHALPTLSLPYILPTLNCDAGRSGFCLLGSSLVWDAAMTCHQQRSIAFLSSGQGDCLVQTKTLFYCQKNLPRGVGDPLCPQKSYVQWTSGVHSTDGSVQ